MFGNFKIKSKVCFLPMLIFTYTKYCSENLCCPENFPSIKSRLNVLSLTFSKNKLTYKIMSTAQCKPQPRTFCGY